MLLADAELELTILYLFMWNLCPWSIALHFIIRVYFNFFSLKKQTNYMIVRLELNQVTARNNAQLALKHLTSPSLAARLQSLSSFDFDAVINLAILASFIPDVESAMDLFELFVLMNYENNYANFCLSHFVHITIPPELGTLNFT